MSHGTVVLQTEGNLAIITLNRPDKRNALSPELIEDLLGALATVEAGPARVAILTGAGQAFCAGMDLAALRTLADQTPAENLTDARRTAGLFRRVWSFPKPLIAAVNGAAYGGGCGLAMLCDFALAAEEAKFGYTEVRIGFMPALISAFLRLQVEEKVLRDLLLTGRVFGAQEAHELGLVNGVVPAGQLLTAARELAAELMMNSPHSLLATKRLLVRFEQDELDRRLEWGVAESIAIRETPELREGLTAFLEKRKPNWSRK
jgi:methylglutaconyl-CoA hydratase